jgi:tetratricopeptide (TPR) repeat protein
MPGRSFRLSIQSANILIAATALFIILLQIGARKAAAFEEQVCDINADAALELEHYPAVIALHRSYLRSHPDNALAHYHLGFAYGMTGRSSEEISEYLKAAGLGLREWDLFLNWGLAYFDQREYPNAIKALETSVSLGPQHAEAHFNLALAYEKAGRLSDAMRETIASLRLAPSDLDARNTKAIICAELGDLRCAHDEWKLLTQIAPNYTPARTNLAILTGSAPESPASVPNTAEIPQLVESETWSISGQ